MLKMSVEKFAEMHRQPGWYIDVCGMYCLNLGRHLIAVFQNDMDGALEVCVNEMSVCGRYEDNQEWETPESEEELVATANHFACKYSNAGGK